MHFLVDSKFVHVSIPAPIDVFLLRRTQNASAEVLASALLQLKNNARLFEKWRMAAYTFKANGKMFRDKYQLTRDET